MGKRGKPKMYCSSRCRDKAAYQRRKNNPDAPRCSEPGCDRVAQGRGLCGPHYGDKWRAKNHDAHAFTCSHCGTKFSRATPLKGQRAFCTPECQRIYTAKSVERDEAWKDQIRKSLHLTRYGEKGTDIELFTTKPKRRPGKLNPIPERQAVWRDTACCVCGERFLDKWRNTTCSDTCRVIRDKESKREHKATRRARKKNAFVANVYRLEIYDRDNYECQICGQKLDMSLTVPAPGAPTIDHIIPLANGGTHEPSNAQAACFMCNAIKGNRHTDDEARERVKEWMIINGVEQGLGEGEDSIMATPET